LTIRTRFSRKGYRFSRSASKAAESRERFRPPRV
jgi:hypothetical protein